MSIHFYPKFNKYLINEVEIRSVSKSGLRSAEYSSWMMKIKIER